MSVLRSVAISASACTFAAFTGNIALGSAISEWYTSLNQPAFGLPFEGWIFVGGLYYILMGIVIYRILRFIDSSEGRFRVLLLAFAVLAGNELWNAVFFGLRSTFWGGIGLVIFLIPVVALGYSLWGRERVSSWLTSAYAGWVIFYDIPWAFALWFLNVHS